MGCSVRFDLGITPYCIKNIKGNETKRSPIGVQGNVTARSYAGGGWGGDVQEQNCSEKPQRLVAGHGEDGNADLFNDSLQLNPLIQRESKKTGNKVVNKDPCSEQRFRNHNQPVTMETLCCPNGNK